MTIAVFIIALLVLVVVHEAGLRPLEPCYVAGVDPVTRDQIKKVSKEGARKAADAKSGKPVSAKHMQRLAELKLKRQMP
jgi:hypothetical protein